ncbi:MAG TPA: SRPBCC domain-containing protein [Candidatus Acidoferrales bacterium]|nr:SRPBCC domain-containing protein [Candidatus Acidoferrales bacterium]
MKSSIPTGLSVLRARRNAADLLPADGFKPLTNRRKHKSYTTALELNCSRDEVFDAINNVREWWSEEVEGRTDQPGARFTIHFNNIHRSAHKITEWVPGKRVVWHVPDARINFVKDQGEWNGTDIIFEISRKGGWTKLRFTHSGLVPEFECYDGCSEAWGFYINESLQRLIMTGQGEPSRKEARRIGSRIIIGAAASL